MSDAPHRQTRPPYFLYGAVGIPLAWCALIVVLLVGSLLFPNHSGGDAGGYDLGPGIAFLVFVGGGSVLAGLILTAISLLRREALRNIGFACLVVYFLPIAWCLLHYAQFLRSRYLYLQYEQAQHSTASP